ncbi:hypothetical protein HYW44_01880 [Candidatus Daviesbacteria bacterium]|nr:hypothetical protein [Candidatus Daviesbacteria bacterium]
MDDSLRSSNLKDYLINNWKSNLSILILLGGLVAGVYLVGHQQIFRPKASSDIQQAFSVTDSDGNPAPFENGAFKTKSTSVKLRINDINSLTQP